VFKRASVGGAANCGACHGNAADGNFNEHEVRIPK
jgi:cytochrome c553